MAEETKEPQQAPTPRQKPTIGRQVRFTRREEGGDVVVRTATISAIRPSQKAQGREITGVERDELLSLHSHGMRLDGVVIERNAKDLEVTLYRRFPRGASPELVDLHVLMPNGNRPVELVEAVPYDAKGEQDVSWSWPGRE